MTLPLRLSLLLLVSMLVSCAKPQPVAASASPEKAKPNVLFISIDDLNDWLAVMDGHPDVQTPNIDRLARRGTLFADTHCQFPLCGPSRASIMTGLLPSTMGITDHLKDKEVEALAAKHGTPLLHETFAQAGYKTMAVGKLFHTHVPEGTIDMSGGREPFGPRPKPAYNWTSDKTSTDWQAWPATDEETADYRTAQWAIERLEEEHDKPFLLMAGFLRPHVPWFAPPEWFEMQKPADEVQLPHYDPADWDDVPEYARSVAWEPQYPTTDWAIKEDQWGNIVQAYLACISFVDHQVGTLLDALEASPYADNTIIILWSDHGYHLGEKGIFKKVTLWDRSTRVPMIIAGPGLPAGQVTHRVTQLLDVYPTLLDLAGLPANPVNEGNSLRPLIDDPEAEWHHPAITNLRAANHSVVTEAYRYIRYADGSEELYDRVQDPHELTNVAARGDLAAIKTELALQLPPDVEE
ncbi:MAG: sulfatase [Synoicihabitans sp.]